MRKVEYFWLDGGIPPPNNAWTWCRDTVAASTVIFDRIKPKEGLSLVVSMSDDLLRKEEHKEFQLEWFLFKLWRAMIMGMGDCDLTLNLHKIWHNYSVISELVDHILRVQELRDENLFTTEERTKELSIYLVKQEWFEQEK